MDKQSNTGKMPKRRYLYLLCTLFVLTVAAFIPNMIMAADKTKVVKKNDNFTVSAQYGLNGAVFYDYPMQAVVTVESKENFSGVIRVLPEANYDQNVSGYGKRITLAAGESKTFKMTVNTPGNNGEVHLAILNDKDKLLYEEKTTLSPTSLGSYVEVGILSDDYSGVGYFNGVSVQSGSYTGSASTVEFTLDTFPEDSQVLSVLNYLIIDNFDTSSLSEKQYKALKKWVGNGGILILSLGSHYQSVLSGFNDDFVSGTFGNMSKKNLSWNAPEEVLTLSGVDCIAFTLDEGKPNDPVYMDDWSYVKPVGLGNVVVLPYSLSMEPMASFTDRSRVASLILAASSTQAAVDNLSGTTNYGSVYSMGMNLTSISEEVKSPSALLYGFLLTLYVVLVGPVLYLILKKAGKQEKLWIAIPLVALIFTGIIYCTGFIYRINKPLLNTFSLIKVDNGGAAETVCSKLVCPNAKQYTFKLSDDYEEFRNNSNYYDYGFWGNNNANDGSFDSLFLDNGTESELIINSNTTFDSFEFSAGRVIDKSIGNFTLDLDCTTSGFSGTVKNDTAYDLKGVVVAYEGNLYIVGDLKKGESATLDEKDMLQTLGYGTFDNLYTSTSTGKLTYEEYQIDSNIESYLLNVSDYKVGHVWGTIVSYKPELIGDNQVKSSGMAVIMNDFYQEYGDVSGNYYPGIESMAVDGQGDYDVGSGYMLGNAVVNVTYSFEGYGDIDMLVLNSDPLDWGVYADVYALNVDTGIYEMIFNGTDVIEGAELSKYMSHGVIQLKYEGTSGDNNYYIPRISAGQSGN